MTSPRPDNTLGLLADSGYDGAGLVLGHLHLDPHAPEFAARCYFRELGNVPLKRRHNGPARPAAKSGHHNPVNVSKDPLDLHAKAPGTHRADPREASPALP